MVKLETVLINEYDKNSYLVLFKTPLTVELSTFGSGIYLENSLLNILIIKSSKEKALEAFHKIIDNLIDGKLVPGVLPEQRDAFLLNCEFIENDNNVRKCSETY